MYVIPYHTPEQTRFISCMSPGSFKQRLPNTVKQSLFVEAGTLGRHFTGDCLLHYTAR